jgi:hypothetical protein
VRNREEEEEAVLLRRLCTARRGERRSRLHSRAMKSGVSFAEPRAIPA